MTDQDNISTVEQIQAPPEPIQSLEEFKQQAEIRKLEAEIAAIERDAHVPWFRSELFLGTLKAVVAGILTIPLAWFFFQKIYIPLSEIDRIDAELQYKKDLEELSNDQDNLSGQIELIKIERDQLAQERGQLVVDNAALSARKEFLEKTLTDLKIKARLTEQEFREFKATLSSDVGDVTLLAVELNACRKELRSNLSEVVRVRQEDGSYRLEFREKYR